MSQASLPLALHLRSEVHSNIFTNERWGPGEKYQEGRSLQDFAFIESYSGRSQATLLFANILRSIFNHPDWSQLYAFFTKRYKKSQMFSDRDARKLTPTETYSRADSCRREEHVLVHFKTDPSSVGLAKDLTVKLAEAGRTSRARMLGPDPQPIAIGPAISIAMGNAAYMDLAYCGKPPGKYPERHRIGAEYYGWDDGKHGVMAGSIATIKKGGRGRSWLEWEDLWGIIAEWVYEYDSTSLEHHVYHNSFSHKKSLPDDVRSKYLFGKMPREYLATDAIDAADAIRDVFADLAKRPNHFQGIEWDFLEIDVEDEVREAFYARFGRKQQDERKNLEDLIRPAGLSSWDSLNYNEVSPVALKPCPESYRGADWEAWLLAVEGGDVVVVKTIYRRSGRSYSSANFH